MPPPRSVVKRSPAFEAGTRVVDERHDHRRGTPHVAKRLCVLEGNQLRTKDFPFSRTRANVWTRSLAHSLKPRSSGGDEGDAWAKEPSPRIWRMSQSVPR